MPAPHTGLLFALVLGAPVSLFGGAPAAVPLFGGAPAAVPLFGGAPAPPMPQAARGMSLVKSAPVSSDSTPRERLWQLLTAAATEVSPRPTSPRYLALETPGLRGFGLFVAWSLPGLSAGDETVLTAVAATLGGEDGWLAARIVRPGRADRVNVWFERRDASAWFGVEVSGTKRSSTKDLELIVLETLAVFEAHAPPAPDEVATKPDEPSSDLSPALVGKTVRRLLPPSARAVVEVQPPDPPDVARVSKVPVRHVVERGDTLTHIARKNGLDLDALVRLNGIDPEAPIHPGDELRVSDKRARRPKLYVVKSGDTFAKVARRFGVSEARLLEVNRLTLKKVETGQKLVLPP
jgi:LysM repeat protein